MKNIYDYYRMHHNMHKEVDAAIKVDVTISDHWEYIQKLMDFLYIYHFDRKSRENGNKRYKLSVTKGYIRLITNMQNAMMDMIRDKGIAIECNPSSNVLIGAIDSYMNHPIFRFYNKGLNVSINTDDQGVFDTSLVNEYTLVAVAYREKRHSVHNTISFMRKIKDNGKNQTFPPC